MVFILIIKDAHVGQSALSLRFPSQEQACNGVKPSKYVSTNNCFPRAPAPTAGTRHFVRSPSSFDELWTSRNVATCPFLLSKLDAKESRLRSSSSNEAHRRIFEPSTSSPCGIPRTRNVDIPSPSCPANVRGDSFPIVPYKSDSFHSTRVGDIIPCRLSPALGLIYY